MRCRRCDHSDSRVLESRPTDGGHGVRRRRACRACDYRFTTYERIETPLVVIKRDQRREAFDHNKILQGLIIACEKRPIGLAELKDIVNKVEESLRSDWEEEVESSFIGQLVLEQLRELDQVAYIRFASVYRQFQDINGFLEELKNLQSVSNTTDGDEGTSKLPPGDH